jgi:hypothetical protein
MIADGFFSLRSLYMHCNFYAREPGFLPLRLKYRTQSVALVESAKRSFVPAARLAHLSWRTGCGSISLIGLS